MHQKITMGRRDRLQLFPFVSYVREANNEQNKTMINYNRCSCVIVVESRRQITESKVNSRKTLRDIQNTDLSLLLIHAVIVSLLLLTQFLSMLNTSDTPITRSK